MYKQGCPQAALFFCKEVIDHSPLFLYDKNKCSYFLERRDEDEKKSAFDG